MSDFGAYLGALQNANMEEEHRKMAKAREQYTEWAACFELLDTKFGEIYGFFKSIQQAVPAWKACPGLYHKEEHLGASGYGYTFYAGIESNDGKKLAVATVQKDHPYTQYGDIDSCLGTIGDERKLIWGGEFEKLESCPLKLHGFDTILKKERHAQPWRTEYLIEYMDEAGIVFYMHMPRAEPENLDKMVDISFLHDNSLVDICKMIFMQMNADKVDPNCLPQVRDIRHINDQLESGSPEQ